MYSAEHMPSFRLALCVLAVLGGAMAFSPPTEPVGTVQFWRPGEINGFGYCDGMDEYLYGSGWDRESETEPGQYCWDLCISSYSNTVAVDYFWEEGDEGPGCYCQDQCPCMHTDESITGMAMIGIDLNDVEPCTYEEKANRPMQKSKRRSRTVD